MKNTTGKIANYETSCGIKLPLDNHGKHGLATRTQQINGKRVRTLPSMEVLGKKNILMKKNHCIQNVMEGRQENTL